MNETTSKLQVRRVSVGYGERIVQHDVTFNVPTGSIFAIMGGSGCGKSTLLQALTGLLRPASGSVCFGTEDYWSATEARRTQIGRRFGVLFQGGALWSSMTAAQNVALPLEMFTRLDAATIDALVQLKLSLVGLDVGRDSMPASLSGGMLKRVGLARALSLEPDLLFLDEPSAGLDPTSAKRLDDLILDLCHGFGMTVVLVSHDLESLLNICDDGIFLDGTTQTAIAHGSPRDLRAHCDNPLVHAFMNRDQPDIRTAASGH